MGMAHNIYMLFIDVNMYADGQIPESAPWQLFFSNGLKKFVQP